MSTDASGTLNKQEWKTLGLSSLGGVLEFYDFIIVFFFAKIISEHFFPAGIGEFWALLNTYGTFCRRVPRTSSRGRRDGALR